FRPAAHRLQRRGGGQPAEAPALAVDPTVVASVQLFVETLALALAQAGEKDEEAGESDFGRRLLIADGGNVSDRSRPLAQRARIGIALRVGPESGAVAEYARRLAVPYAVHGSPPWPCSIRPPSAQVKAGTIAVVRRETRGTSAANAV